ncbi:hypothetical protein MPSEU_000933200 [Mayamaea pseudoterrestris]|nr:hypothetical protein MPSEU_000933200 [Mayamaea pseudoterrestris]
MRSDVIKKSHATRRFVSQRNSQFTRRPSFVSFTMVPTNKRKGESDTMTSPSSVAVKSGSDWKSVQAKMNALKLGPIDDDKFTSPRSITDQLWQAKEESMLNEAAKMQSELDRMINDAASASELESDALYEAQKKVMSLTAQRDTLQMDVNDAEQEIMALTDEIARNKEQAKDIKEETMRLQHEREQELLMATYKRSLLAKCTGITWNDEEEDVLSGIVDVASGETFRSFSVDPKGMTPFELANKLWSIMDGETEGATDAEEGS